MCSGLEVLNIYGCVNEEQGLPILRSRLGSAVKINMPEFLFSTIARPTVGIRRTSIWGHRTRDE